ncbi:MAG: hypothetical protein GYB64_18335, partial [Chloroflexi bacterium]|nr:hypothetical protein [Chloroflexota bacterium]
MSDRLDAALVAANAALLAVVGLHTLTGDALWPAALLANFFNWLLLAAILTIPVSAVRRCWAAAGLGAVNALIFLVMYGGLLLPPPRPPADDDALLVMSANLGFSRVDNDALIELVRTIEPDILATQETLPGTEAALDSQLDAMYPHRARVEALTILSRYPIRSREALAFDQFKYPVLRAVVDVEGDLIEVYTLDLPDPTLTLQPLRYNIAAGEDFFRMTLLADPDKPQIWMGDFNMTQRSDHYELVQASGLVDAHRAAGWGFGSTFPRGGVA